MNAENPPVYPHLPETPLEALGPIEEQTVYIEEHTFRITQPTNSDRLLDHPQVRSAHDADEYMPYWADLWPGARMMAKAILRNFVLAAPDSFIIFSNSGVNEVVVEMALEAKARHLPVIAVVSVEHCLASQPKHSSGKRLVDVADVTLDNCTPAGDALVRVEGLPDPVGPGSTIGAAAITNALKCLIADRLTRLGKPPIVLTSSYFIGVEASKKQFDACYDDYRARVKRVYG